MVMTLSVHLYFRATRQGKERGLYPPSGWFQRTRGVGAFKSWGCILLIVGSVELKELVLPSSWFL
jgi:hypothetical protein